MNQRPPTAYDELITDLDAGVAWLAAATAGGALLFITCVSLIYAFLVLLFSL